MCIYYTDRENLTYNSQEHIFSAAIGGINMLPKGYVSDQANNSLSKMELLTFTRSIIALSRNFEGPGKRGSKNPKGKHNICLMTGLQSSEKFLGFTFMGTPYMIPQVRFNVQNGEVHYTRNPYDEKGFEKMFEAFTSFDGKYVDLKEKELQDHQIFIGVNAENVFVAHNENFKVTNEKLQKIFLAFQDNFNSDPFKGLAKYDAEQVQTQSQLVESPECSKTYAKIAINALAHLKGKEYVCTPEFSDIKEWISNESSTNSKYHCFPTQATLVQKMYPPDSHSCLFMNVKGFLVADICLYGFWRRVFKLCESFDDYFNMPDGYICDWKNKKEFTFRETLLTHCSNFN